MPFFTRLVTRAPLLLLALVLALALAACQSEPPRVSGDILFQDDFSDPTSGWQQTDQEFGETRYGDGFYRILVNTIRKYYWANPGLNLSNVRIEVEATKAGGPDDNDFGVICRYKDTQNFYKFLITSDGYYGIVKVQGGIQIPLGSRDLEFSHAILLGDATNHIRADCVEKTLTLYINGELVSQVQDAEFKTGDVGLLAGSFDNPGVDIHFENFIVMMP